MGSRPKPKIQRSKKAESEREMMTDGESRTKMAWAMGMTVLWMEIKAGNPISRLHFSMRILAYFRCWCRRRSWRWRWRRRRLFAACRIHRCCSKFCCRFSRCYSARDSIGRSAGLQDAAAEAKRLRGVSFKGVQTTIRHCSAYQSGF